MSKALAPQSLRMSIMPLSISSSNVSISAKVGILSGVFFFVFKDAFAYMANTWMGRDDYSFGFLVPLVSLYIIYTKREKLRCLPIKPNLLAGALVMVLGGFMFIAGRISGGVFALELSVLIVVPGLVLILLGRTYAERLAFPLAYLFLMVPVLDLVIEKIQFPFQILSATMGGILLKSMNIPVVQNNQYLELPKIVLEVAPECSGLKYLVSIFAIALPIAFYTLRSWQRQVALLVLAFIIGITTNILRIALIGVWNVVIESSTVHGPFDMFQAMFVSVVGFVALFLAAFALSPNPYPHSVKSDQPLHSSEVLEENPPKHDMKKFQIGWILSLIILFCIGFYAKWHAPYPVPLTTLLPTIPHAIQEWRGVDVIPSEPPFGLQGADNTLLRKYRISHGAMVQLFIGYFESQENDKKIIHYRSKLSNTDHEKISINVDGSGSIEVNKMLLKDKQHTQAVIFFYYANGRTIANRYEAKALFGLNALLRRRTNGAVVVVSHEVAPGCSVDAIFEQEARFVKRAYPFIRNVLP